MKSTLGMCLSIRKHFRDIISQNNNYALFSTPAAPKEGLDAAPRKSVLRQDFREANKTLIAKILGLSEQDVVRPPRKMVVEEGATEVWKVLQAHGFGAGEVVRYPDLFMMSPWATKNYIDIMNESCFSSVELSQILNFTILYKQSLGFLQDKKLTPNVPDIVQSYFEVLEMSKKTEVEDCVWNALPSDMSRLSLNDLRKIVIAQYLCWKLNASLETVEKSVVKYPRLNLRSMNWIKQSLSLLMNELQLDSEKILRHVYILSGNPSNTAAILRTIDSLSGMQLRPLVTARPKILMSQKESLLEIQELFRIHEISTETLLKHPELYTLCPSTVKKRLEEFDTVPEFRPLKKHPRVSRLIYYQKKAKQRVEYFRTHNMTGASLHLLSSDRKRFKKRMTVGDIRSKGKDIVNYLKEALDIPDLTVKEIRENIMRQPHWLQITSLNAKDSLKFIESFSVFTKEQITSALPLVLYPQDKIEKVFQNVLDSKEAQLTDPYFLHMVLYFLEKPVHFSGDGVWHNNSQKVEDDDAEVKSELVEDPEEENQEAHEVISEEEIVFGDSLEDTLKVKSDK